MEHSKLEQQIMENYKNAIDIDVLVYIKKIYNGEEVAPITVGFLTDKASDDIERLTGKKVYGNRIVLDSNGVIHIKNRHGKNGKLAPKVIISKKIDGTFYVIEAVSNAKKHRNYIISAYIKLRKNESDLSVPNNA